MASDASSSGATAGDVKSMSSILLVAEARRRGMVARVLEPQLKLSLISYTDASGQKQDVLVRNTRCELVSAVGALVADDKAATIALAKEYDLPVPATEVYTTPEAARAFLAREGRIVVKPSDGGHGNGVTTNIRTPDELDGAVARAKEHTTGLGSAQVLLQTHCDGDDYRVLVVGGKMVAAAQRLPAFVIGDGAASIGALIAAKNKDPRRGEGHGFPMTLIDPEEVAAFFAGGGSAAPDGTLQTLDSVPPAGIRVNCLGVANVSKGGEAHDVTDIIHPATVALCERFARVAGLGVCGADLVCRDITKPPTEGATAAERPAFMELNAAPGLRMHHHPTEGKGRDAAGAILDHIVFTRAHSDKWRDQPWGDNAVLPAAAAASEE